MITFKIKVKDDGQSLSPPMQFGLTKPLPRWQ